MQTKQTTFFFHVDIDSFFAQVAQLDHPELRGKPVIVGGSSRSKKRKRTNKIDHKNQHTQPDIQSRSKSSRQDYLIQNPTRGIVTTSSYEARAFGVRTAMPIGEALQLCPHAICVRGSFERYTQLSKQVFTVCKSFTPEIEMGGIDEAYLNVTGLKRWYCSQLNRSQTHSIEAKHNNKFPINDPEVHDTIHWLVCFASELKQRIYNETGLAVSVGGGANTLIAKVGSKHAKPNGIHIVPNHLAKAFLAPLPIRAIPGVGTATATRLNQFNYHYIKDIANLPSPDPLITAIGSNSAIWLWNRAQGIGRTHLNLPHERRSISRERTFFDNIISYDKLSAILIALTEKACWSLRKKGLRAGCISVKLRDANFKTRSRNTTLSIDRALPGHTDLDKDLRTQAQRLLCQLLGRNPAQTSDIPITNRNAKIIHDTNNDRIKPVRLIGVSLTHLTAHGHRQLFLGEGGDSHDATDNPRYQRNNTGYIHNPSGNFEKQCQLHKAADEIRNRYGFDAMTSLRAKIAGV